MKKLFRGLLLVFLSVFAFGATIGLIELGCRVMLWAGKDQAYFHAKPVSPLNTYNDIEQAVTNNDPKHMEMAQRLIDYGIGEYQKRKRQDAPPIVRYEPPLYLNGLKTGRTLHYTIFPTDLDDTFIKVGAHSGAEKLRFHLKTNAHHRRD